MTTSRERREARRAKQEAAAKVRQDWEANRKRIEEARARRRERAAEIRAEAEEAGTLQADRPKAKAGLLSHAWAAVAKWARPAPKVAEDRTKFVVPSQPPGVVPESAGIAQDAAIEVALDWAEECYGEDLEFEAFLGFPALAELAQRPEYRRMADVFAQEATRNWIKLTSTGDVDVSKKIQEIEDAMKKLAVRQLFRALSEKDSYFGRIHLYVDLGDDEDVEELKTPIGNGRDSVTKLKVRQGSLQGFRIVEPVWTYPRGGDYNTTNPLAPNWYRPQSWLVMGKQVHATRLLTFVGRPVPDLFKPLYAFGGLSLSQMVKPYIDNWIRTRRSISDLIKSFSVSGFTTDLTDALTEEGGALLANRVDAFVAMRDNRNCMVLDKGGGETPPEEFFNVSTPLSGLAELQDQVQGQMASICGIPLVKLLGVTPSGLNASSDGEVRTFYDTVLAYQERFFRPHLETVIGIIQHDLYGEVDPSIVFNFEPLWTPSEKEAAEIRKTDAETAMTYIDGNVILASEERSRLANDDKSLYPGLDMSVEIAPPASELDEEGDEDLPEVPEPSQDPETEVDEREEEREAA